MRNALKAFLVPAASLGLAWSLCAADYFVDQKAPNASDANTGSKEAPFKTVNGSFKGLKPGDCVWIASGVYREQVMLSSKSGSVDKWSYSVVPSGKDFSQMLSFCALPGAEVVIKGSDVVKGWRPLEGGALKNAWVREGWDVNSQQVFVDGSPLQQIAGEMPKSLMEYWSGRKGKGLEDLEPGSFFYDAKGRRLYICLKDASDPNGLEVEVSVRPFLWRMSELDYVKLVGLKMLHSNVSATVNWPAFTVDGACNIVERVESSSTDFIGMGFSGSSHTFVDCKFNANGNSGVAGRGWGHRLVRCETSWNNYRRWNPGWHAGGVKIIPYCHDTVVSGHLAANNIDSPGIWFDGWNSNVTIQDSIARNNGGAGIMYEISERATIKNNICYENRERGIYVSNSSYVQVLHNLCFRNGMSGLAMVAVDRFDESEIYGRGAKGAVPGGHNVVWGNVFMDNCLPGLCPKGWEGRPEMILSADSDYNEGTVSDYNVFWRSDRRPIPFWKGWDNYIGRDLAEWRRNSGQDLHSVVAEPLFKDLERRDFHPLDSSPALCMVKPSQCMVSDFDGRPRPTGCEGQVKSFFTAGPYEASLATLKKCATLGKAPGAGGFLFVALPDARSSSLAQGGDALQAFCKALQSLPRQSLAGGASGFKFADVPFAEKASLSGVLLSESSLSALIPVAAKAKRLHFLVAAFDCDPSSAIASCKVKRQDGVTIPLTWVSGRDCGPSSGAWSGKLEGSGGNLQSSQAFEGQDGDAKGRLFKSTWVNENEWYPVDSLEFKLESPGAKFAILGVTVE